MNGTDTPIAILGVGAHTPLGPSAPMSAAVVRAGIAAFSEHPFLVWKDFSPIVSATNPEMPEDMPVAHRMVEMAKHAASEALSNVIPRHGVGKRITVFLGLPSPRPGLSEHTLADIASSIASALKTSFGCTATHMIASGHAAGLLAMEQAVAAIRANMTDMCLIAAADSYHDQATIDWLADNNQLHGKENSWGFIPGEGAGAVLVGNTNCIQQANIEMLGHVLAVASAREQNTIKTDSICTGAGLTLAIRTALSALSSDCRVDEICCDLNGEPYRADEFTFVLARQSSRFHSPTEFVAPADCWGDMGAAAGPLHVCLALAAGHKGYARGPISLVWGSSETGERAAALLSIPVGPKPE